jgi:hypothetical protein
MEEKKLRNETEEALETLAERAARKLGYMDTMNGSYKEFLDYAIALKREQMEKKIDKMGHNVRLRPRRTPFGEEIKAYFRHSIQSLMDEEKSEEEALKIVIGEVDQAELKPDFESFALVFDGFWTQEYSSWENLQVHHGELEGLFYSAFLVLGITLGTLIGYLFGHSLGNTIIGFAVGLFAGLSCGLFTHAILRWRKG